jgi:glutamate-1-semialdehyde 2,1-aminomutase
MDAVCDMIGIPTGDRPRVITYLQRIRRDPNDKEAEHDLRAFLEDLTNQRIIHQRDDLVSAMARAPRELVPIHDAVDFSWDFLTGSVGSVASSIANGVLALGEHPDQLPVLRALDPGGVRLAVEEFLRYDSPVHVQPRVAHEDVEFQGVRMAAGSQIWLVLGSANRDERVFADPDRLDLRRANATRHVAFGNGIHFCVGAPLTRLAMRVALPLLVDTLSRPKGWAMTTEVDQTRATMDDPKFQRSLGYIKTAREVIPRGVSSVARARPQSVLLCIDHGAGSRIFDVDGNEYVDYKGASGPLLLGHCPAPVVTALKAQLDRGLTYAMQHAGEADLARRVVELMPSVDMVTFYSSGSEAVHGALGTARGVTGRRLIVKFEGHYHGWIEPINVNGPGSAPSEGPIPFPIVSSPGWPGTDDVLVLPWNDPDALREVLRSHPDQIAAVIMEPVAINAGCLRPFPGYLEQVRELCTEHGALLIFDEIVTGFRVALGGAQELFGVMPDLTVMAKAIASGFPLSALGGSRSVMERAIEVDVPFRGTYNGNPLATTAAITTLDYLKQNRQELYPRLEQLATSLAAGITRIANNLGAPVVVNQAGSVIFLLWGSPNPTTTYSDFSSSDASAMGRLESALLRNGVLINPDGRLFLSTAHTREDVDETLAAMERALAEV